MSATPEQPLEAEHLDVAPYDDDDRAEPPDWYDDFIDVGDEVE